MKVLTHDAVQQRYFVAVSGCVDGPLYDRAAPLAAPEFDNGLELP